MFSPKSFSSWERNWAEDGSFLCDVRWRKVNQSTPLLPIQQEDDDYQKAKQTKPTKWLLTATLQRHHSFLFLSLVGGWAVWSVHQGHYDFTFQWNCTFFWQVFGVSCFMDWLSKTSLVLSWCRVLGSPHEHHLFSLCWQSSLETIELNQRLVCLHHLGWCIGSRIARMKTFLFCKVFILH